MGILLTPEEMVQAIAGMGTTLEEKGLVPPYEGITQAMRFEAICRAQVRKVVEWLEEDCREHETPLYMLSNPVDRASCPECRRALRAAGEGK